MIKSQKLDKYICHRLAIYSKDAISGNWSNGTFAVNLDDIPIQNNMMFAIENFALKAGNTITASVPFTIELLDINQADTYNTNTKMQNRIAFVGHIGSDTASFQNSICANTVGIPLMDTHAFQNKQIRIQLKDWNDSNTNLTTALGASSFWIMTIVIYEFTL